MIRIIWTSCLLTFFLAALRAQQPAADTFLIKPYLQWSTQSSMYVLWETAQAGTSVVEYGLAKAGANEAVLDQKKVLPGKRQLHEVQLEQLETATKYLYRVSTTLDNGQIINSPVLTFKTTVKEEDAYFFALVGDSQYNSKTPWAWEKIADRVWRERPNFVIHAGDLVDVGTRKPDWTQHFFPNGNIFMSRLPMYTVLGNHEQDAQLYYDYMVNPAPEYYYTFKYGNAQFFMIDTNRDVKEGSEQYNWLEWELAQSTATWKFVVHHHPPYSSEENDHGDTYIGASSYGTHARNLVPLYEAYDVDFCLFGHTHVYERTWPLLKDQINLKNGVIYINSGGAGGGLEDFDPVRSWFTQELQTGHHYCTFAVYQDQLMFKAIDHEGRIFDMFQLTKAAEKSFGISLPPAPHFKIDKSVFQHQATAQLSALKPNYKIYYTLDGSPPNQQAQRYTGPISIDKTCTMKAICYTENGKASRMVSRKFLQMPPHPAMKDIKTTQGLTYKYYEGDWEFLPDFSTLKAQKTGIIRLANIEAIDHREEHFGVVIEGYIEVPATDTYTFYTYSDDGSKLYINGELLVDSDGRHSAKYIYGTTILEKGKHQLKIEYFEGSGNNFVYAGFVTDENERVPFTPFQLSH
ncbi:MAG: metallophosphoesterase [Bacteroidota bacterium]